MASHVKLISYHVFHTIQVITSKFCNFKNIITQK